MKNSLKAEIAREARRSYPLKKDDWIFKGLKIGETVYLLRHGEGPVAEIVKKVGATEAILAGSGTVFRLDTGAVKLCAHTKPCVVLLETLAIKEQAEIIRLRKELARAFGTFTASRPGRARLLEVLRALDPDAWK